MVFDLAKFFLPVFAMKRYLLALTIALVALHSLISCTMSYSTTTSNIDRHWGDSSRKANNVRTYHYPHYYGEPTIFGWLAIGATAAGAGYLGYTFPFRTSSGELERVGTAALLGLAGGYVASLIFTPNAFVQRPIQKNETEKWIEDVDKSIKIIAGTIELAVDERDEKTKKVIEIKSISAIPISQEKNFKFYSLKSIELFDKAFPNSSMINAYLPDIIKRKILNIRELNQVLSIYPSNQFVYSSIAEENLRQAQSIQECRLVYEKFSYLSNQAEKKAESIAWKINTRATFEEMIALFPATKNKSVLEQKIAELKLQEYKEAFQQAEWQNTSLAFTKYISKYNNLAPKYLIDKARINEYKLSYDECKTIKDFTVFIEKYDLNDPEKLVPKAKMQLYQATFKECKYSYDFEQFAEKFEKFDPEGLVATAREKAYELMYKEAKTAIEYKAFINKYKSNDPKNLIPDAEEQYAYLLEKERQERIAEAQRKEEQRQLEEKFRNTKWTYEILWDYKDEKYEGNCDFKTYKKGRIFCTKYDEQDRPTSEYKSVQFEINHKASINAIGQKYCSQTFELSFSHSLKYGSITMTKTDNSEWRVGYFDPPSWWNGSDFAPSRALDLVATQFIKNVLQKPH